MGKKHILSLDDTFEDAFHLFAIYSDEDDYRLAFLMNKNLQLQLTKAESVFRKKDNAYFNTFEFDDITFYQNWLLINNHTTVEKKVNLGNSLFNDENHILNEKVIFLKELKNARFLLKLTTDENSAYLNKVTDKLQQIPQIYAVELVHLTPNLNQKFLIL